MIGAFGLCLYGGQRAYVRSTSGDGLPRDCDEALATGTIHGWSHLTGCTLDTPNAVQVYERHLLSRDTKTLGYFVPLVHSRDAQVPEKVLVKVDPRGALGPTVVELFSRRQAGSAALSGRVTYDVRGLLEVGIDVDEASRAELKRVVGPRFLTIVENKPLPSAFSAAGLIALGLILGVASFFVKSSR
jgi:hypothetical protein